MAKKIFILNVSLLIINLVSFLIFFVIGMATQLILGLIQLVIMLLLPGLFKNDFHHIRNGYWIYWAMVVGYFLVAGMLYLILNLNELHEINLMILGVVFVLLIPIAIATHSVYLTYRLWSLAEKRKETLKNSINDSG